MSSGQCACHVHRAKRGSAQKQNKLLTVICADPSDVIRLQDEVTWFVPSLKLTVFPDWETLPYDVLSPHADLVGERLRHCICFKSSKRQDPVDVLIVSPALRPSVLHRETISAQQPSSSARATASIQRTYVLN
ncbi:MAG: hypothetical protein ACLRRK_03985 [Parasutterella sp.]